MHSQTSSPRRKTLIGWREWVALPDLGVARIKAKVDTGARTSAVHAWNVELREADDGPWVRFELRPLQRDNDTVVACRARLLDVRDIRNTSGGKERRYVVATRLGLGDDAWPIELSLANRDEMGFRMLIGRAAVRGRATVDPGRSFLLGPGRPADNRSTPRRQSGPRT